MTLTKADIQKIDSHLKKQGISYWDIRLEMTDHIACDMENKEGSYDFENLFRYSLEELGWNGNLKHLEYQKLKSINAKFRSAYHRNFLTLFTDVKNIAVIILSIILYYLILQNSSQQLFNYITILLFLGPIGFITIHYAVTSFKLKKSGYVFYAYFYAIFALFITNLFYQIPKPGGLVDVSIDTRNIIVFWATIVNVLFTIGGIKIYLKTYKEYNAIHKKLIS